MKFAIAIAALFASANAVEVMSETEISTMTFDDQVGLINDVKSESNSLRDKIAQLKAQNIEDTQRMNTAIKTCETELGEKQGDLATLSGLTWTNLVAQHKEELKDHKDTLTDAYGTEEDRLEGLLEDEKKTLAEEVKDTGDALGEKKTAEKRETDANNRKIGLEDDHSKAINALDAAQGPIYQPIEDDRAAQSSEEDRLKELQKTNAGTITGLEDDHGKKTKQSDDLHEDIKAIEKQQEEALKAHNGIIDPINSEIVAENKRHEEEVTKLEGKYNDMVKERSEQDPKTIQNEIDRLTEVRDQAVKDATAMSSDTIYEVCTKIDQEGDSELPVTINTVNSDNSDQETI